METQTGTTPGAPDFHLAPVSSLPSKHPAADYIRDLFEPDENVCLTLIDQSRRDANGHCRTQNVLSTAADLSSEETITSLDEWNRDGWSVFVCMQPVKAGSTSRKKEDLAEVRRVFLDLDDNAGAAYEKVLTSDLVPEPHWVLESSPNKLQLIWNVEPMEQGDLEALLASMIGMFGADRACSDVSRVLRLPGFRNTKYPERPVVKLKAAHFDPTPYPRSAFKITSVKPKATTRTQSTFTPDPAFQALREKVRFRPLIRRLNSMPDARFHVTDIVPGKNIVCPFHEHRNWSAQFGTMPSNPMVLHCFGNCAKTGDGKTSWDIISAVARFDNLPNNSEAARLICEEEGLDYHALFPHIPCVIGGIDVADPNRTSAPSPATSLPKATMNLRRADEIKMKKLRWLWPFRIPLGKITVFAGNPDQGKSLATAACAATITTGTDWPDCDNPFPASEVLILSGEDDPEDTLVPRLTAAGADLSKVHVLHSTLEWTSINGKTSSTEREVQLDSDLQRLTEVMREHPDIKLIVVDPITHYLGATKMIDEKDVRAKVLTPLRNFAARNNVSIVMVMHLNKKCDLAAIHRLSGAMAFAGVARAAWLFVADPENKDQKFMLKVKNNLAKTVGGLKYRIVSASVEIEGSQESMPVIEWGGVVEKDADDVLFTTADKKEAGRPSVMNEAVEWLTSFLKSAPRLVSDVYTFGDGKANLSKRTLQRAAKIMKIEPYQKDKKWWWKLPDEDGSEPTLPW